MPETGETGSSGFGGRVVGGAAKSVMTDLAIDLAKDWYKELKARKQIVRLFREACTDGGISLRTDVTDITVASLRFRWSEKQLDYTKDVYHRVEVIKEDAPGDDPHRVRVFRYFTGENRGGFILRFISDTPKGGVRWPPFV
ncbi:hypothetical protein ACGFNV_11110 [Streptomyces sp. NPDC048751]|uniref:hypothetical protein n=1 Tax=Streptomyces sp. NPDC048751 TaxID=3365591 RepID=UPI00371C4D49